MPFLLKKTIHAILFNLSLFLILIIGIQNSSNKTKINLLIAESVKLPVSFTIGISFITGSIIGSCLSLTKSKKD
tara:strand:+ start:802 stop:1023 length:222 start_codon:yes stop_codon:yes gene_type:complete